MKHLTPSQNELRLNTIIAKLTEEVDRFEQCIIPDAIKLGASAKAYFQLGTRIISILRYIEERKDDRESKTEEPSYKEKFTLLKTRIQNLILTTIPHANEKEIARNWLNGIDTKNTPTPDQVAAAHQCVVNDIKSKADFFYMQANSTILRQDNIIAELSRCCGFIRNALAHYQRLDDAKAIDQCLTIRQKLHEQITNNKRMPPPSPSNSLQRVLRILAENDLDNEMKKTTDDQYLEECVISEAHLELNKYYEQVRIPIPAGTKFRKILAIDIDDTIIAQQYPQSAIEFINLDAILATLANIPDDVMVVLLTARYSPEPWVDNANNIADKLEELLGKKIFKSTFFTGANSKKITLDELHERHIMFQPNTSAADVGLLDDRNSSVHEVRNAGYTGILVTTTNLKHFKKVDKFTRLPAPTIPLQNLSIQSPSSTPTTPSPSNSTI